MLRQRWSQFYWSGPKIFSNAILFTSGVIDPASPALSTCSCSPSSNPARGMHRPLQLSFPFVNPASLAPALVPRRQSSESSTRSHSPSSIQWVQHLLPCCCQGGARADHYCLILRTPSPRHASQIRGDDSPNTIAFLCNTAAAGSSSPNTMATRSSRPGTSLLLHSFPSRNHDLCNTRIFSKEIIFYNIYT
jgi:hypothetical protein